MKFVSFSCNPGTRKDPGASLENLRVLTAAMGINNLTGVNVPEQEFILNLLVEHGSEGLSTRELADQCGMSIYKVRHLLLPLEKYGQVIRNKMQKHHKWYLPTEHIEIERHFNKGVFHLQQR
ncbi:FaeA/PapI family transcriptional regulator [Entomohabitans teleogrylli]|uniref:FaeA/PapI family transcriptional regulator n=1 Tax=Entomohabitans teleogrylli TaxID=1384589 RepID=UPI00073DA605|nr:FaeA/PapI family transcriptional regulator [Entomohabitans teleogrylli]